MEKHSILIVADPYIPIPPLTYGGVERIVGMLAEELVIRGWNATLACHSESTCEVNTLSLPGTRPGRNGRLLNIWSLAKHLAWKRYDLVHSFAHFDLTAGLWPTRQKQIQSFQSFPDETPLAKRLHVIPRRNLWITTCGHHMKNVYSAIAPTTAIHNGVKIEQFDFQPKVEQDAPLVFLGRIEPIKGTHEAIRIALETGRRLIIAGNRSEKPHIDQYFREKVEPQLSDRIRYIGPVNDVQKNTLLGSSAALLMPIEWDEPFGIVMAEALACGTPVIGSARGALPEIVQSGRTGACCESVEEMIEAVHQVHAFSRHACRESAEHRFSSQVIVDQYEEIYKMILGDAFSG